MCNWRACPQIAVRGSTVASVLVTIGLAKRSDHGGMNHLSGYQIIRLLFSKSQEFVDDLSLPAFAMARHPAHSHLPLVWSREGEMIRQPLSRREVRHVDRRVVVNLWDGPPLFPAS
jgi:hypothetical protein